MIRTRNGYKFETTGAEFYCNNGTIGINHSKEISEGYDGAIFKLNDDLEEVELTKAEKSELARHMIDLWADFGQISIIK